MQTHLSREFVDTADGQRAEDILRKCVHCGFCTATCPTYQLLGDELDGPRGRIYLIKQVLEGEPVTRKTQLHLDRCLTCRNCETTCPSGVEYAALLDIGRRIVDEKVPRPALERARRGLLRENLASPMFNMALRAGQTVRPLLPNVLRQKVPPASRDRRPTWKPREHARKVILPAGCVQPAMAPNIMGATKRVLDAAGIQSVAAESKACCGAIRLHMADRAGAQNEARRNIDAWWPLIQANQVEAIISNASGCGVTIKEYAELLRDDPEYANKARRVGELTQDVSQLLPDLVEGLRNTLQAAALPSLVLHTPCTLQHGQQLRNSIMPGLRELGFTVRTSASEAHLCCGSAGTYSILQPGLATQLRDRKLKNLATQPQEVLVSANVGCIHHLQSGTTTPVQHWIEVLDAALGE